MKATERTIELRRALVAIADATPFARRWPRRRVAIGAIAALALAGAATGGAVFASSDLRFDELSEEHVKLSGETTAQLLVGTHAELYGSPFNFAAQGKTVLNVGEKPNGATALSFSIDCVDPGTYDYLLDGELVGSTTCEQESIDQLGGGGGPLGVPGDGIHTVTISGPGRYIVWAQWSSEQIVPGPTAEQLAALADGVVTREEYVAGFYRFVACMEDAGTQVLYSDVSTTVINYSLPAAAVDDGTDRRCYEPEFMKIDTEWQIANEETSETAQWLRDCLTAVGIEPAPTMADQLQQLADHGMEVTDCAA